jgi:hypothetical protein
VGGIGVAVVLAVAGCGTNVSGGLPRAIPSPSATDPVSEHEKAWNSKEPRAYEFTLRYGSMIGPRAARIRVEDGRIVSVSRVKGVPALLPGSDKAVTLDGLFEQVRADMREADEVRVTYDRIWGFPASVFVDEMRNAIDDEHGYAVRDFRPKG